MSCTDKLQIGRRKSRISATKAALTASKCALRVPLPSITATSESVWQAEPTAQSPASVDPEGVIPKTQDGAAPKREKRIPEYLESDEVERHHQSSAQPEGEAANAPTVAGRSACVSEALDLEVRDLSLDTATPTLRVRSGKGGKTQACAGASGAARRSE